MNIINLLGSGCFWIGFFTGYIISGVIIFWVRYTNKKNGWIMVNKNNIN